MNVYIRSYFHNDTIKILVLKTIANICTLVRTLSEKSIPKDYFNFLKHENNDIDNESKSRNRLKLLNNLHEYLLNTSLLYLSGLFGRQETKSNMTKFITIELYFIIYGNRF